MAASISFVCPYCRAAPMESPEKLCLHVEDVHQERDLVAEKDFSSGKELERWLNRVEESRCEGGVLGSDNGEASGDTEFYILCSRQTTPQLKRRRLESSGRESLDTYVSCTAFVHIEEKMDGTFHVKYCLDHASDCEVNNEVPNTLKTRKTTTMKRRSHEKIGQLPCSSQAGSSRPCNAEVRHSPENFGLSSMNRFLNHRIDTAANSLKALNQMISDLAMDINNRLWDTPPPPIVPVHLPNEIYTS